MMNMLNVGMDIQYEYDDKILTWESNQPIAKLVALDMSDEVIINNKAYKKSKMTFNQSNTRLTIVLAD